ncbi:hypothetical protein BDZ91DRAFT_114520 [Kalaharituber pfeilii]|nr:hypothetical protein BDZ91DRAFT_114520 [Kalaharituber pfeilii]
MARCFCVCFFCEILIQFWEKSLLSPGATCWRFFLLLHKQWGKSRLSSDPEKVLRTYEYKQNISGNVTQWKTKSKICSNGSLLCFASRVPVSYPIVFVVHCATTGAMCSTLFFFFLT